MYQTLLKIPLPDVAWLPPEIEVRGYGLMLALGFIAAILVAMYRCRRRGLNPEHIYNLGIMAIVGGVLGARLFQVIEYAGRPEHGNLYVNWTEGFNIFSGLGVTWLLLGLVAGAALAAVGVLPWAQGRPPKRRWLTVAAWGAVIGLVAGRAQYILSARQAAESAGADGAQLPFQGFIEALQITSGGLTVYGGLILATAIIVPYLIFLHRKHGVNPLQLADVIAPSLALGLAFGRVGCFLNGCCFGGPSDLPWAFTWPEGSIPWNAGMHGPIHPAQLYGVINALLLFVLLSVLLNRKRRHGQVLGAFFGLYAVSRFLLEWVRLDEPKEFAGSLELTISQTVSLVAIIPIILYFLILPRLKASRIETGDPNAGDGGDGRDVAAKSNRVVEQASN